MNENIEKTETKLNKEDNEISLIRVYQELQHLMDKMDFSSYRGQNEWEKSIAQVKEIRDRVGKLIHNDINNEEQK